MKTLLALLLACVLLAPSCLAQDDSGQRLRGRKTVQTAVKEALRQSDVSAWNKFVARAFMALPAGRAAVEDFVLDSAAERGISVSSASEPLLDEIWLEIIKLILEKLPEIIELIITLIGQQPVPTIAATGPPTLSLPQNLSLAA